MSDNIKDALWSFRDNKKAQLIILVLVVVAVSAGAGYVVFRGKGTSSNTNTFSNTNTTQEPSVVARAIDGVLVASDQANPLPNAVMVENLVGARPQSGLDKANVVYEALAEGGITRFLAIFASTDSVPKIGPVRSARSYYLDWAKEYDALYAHAGGSPQALLDIPKDGIRDLNQFFHSQYFWRDKDRLNKLPLEHTLYTSSELLARAQRDLTTPDHGTYIPWAFADGPTLAARPTVEEKITIDFSTFNYKVDYVYDRASNAYKRSQGEQPHRMEDGSQITVKNVIVEYIPATLAGDDKGRLTMQTIGQGKAVVFHNGQATEATWKKPDQVSRTRLYDTAGKEITFTVGSTWIEIVPPDHQIVYN